MGQPIFRNFSKENCGISGLTKNGISGNSGLSGIATSNGGPSIDTALAGADTEISFRESKSSAEAPMGWECGEGLDLPRKNFGFFYREKTYFGGLSATKFKVYVHNQHLLHTYM
jgi:hypothetical protein